MTAAIELEDVRKVYANRVQALHGVTLEVDEGEIFGFLGRNGAGKTTTIRILSTLTAATAGTARVGGYRVDTEPAEVRRRIGVAMQEAALDELMTAREHLELVARLAGSTRSEANGRAAQLLETFGLSEAADRVVATYSGGMRRRVDIAMALVHRPSILFLDEPTAGLDPQSRRATWALIRDLRADGVTIFLTTQYMEEADELSDRVAVIDAGRVVGMGAPRDLKSDLGKTTVSFRLDGEAIRLELDGGREVMELFAGLRGRGAHIEDVSVSEPSLEDVFVGLTGEGLDGSAGSDAAIDLTNARRFQLVPGGRR